MGQKKSLPSRIGDPGLQVITNGGMTGTATIISSLINVQNTDNVGIQVKWSGTPTGTISVLGSVNNADFVALTFSPVLTQPAGASGGYLISLNQVPYPYLQVQYTNTSGSGTLNAWISLKDLN